jgi:hypothetical protein
MTSAAKRNDCQLWFNAEAIRWSKHEVQFCNGPDSEASAGFVTSAVEQLALIASGNFHRVPFV